MPILTESQLRKLAGLPPRVIPLVIKEEASDELVDFMPVKDEEDHYKEMVDMAAKMLDVTVDDMAHISSIKNPDEVEDYAAEFVGDADSSEEDGDAKFEMGVLFDHPAVKLVKHEGEEDITCFFVKCSDVAHLSAEPSEEPEMTGEAPPAEEPAEEDEDKEMDEAFSKLASKFEGVKDKDALMKMVKEVYKAGKADSGKTVVTENEEEVVENSSAEMHHFDEIFKMRAEATKLLDSALEKMERSVNVYNIDVKTELKAAGTDFDKFCTTIESIEKDILEDMQERAKLFAGKSKEDIKAAIKKNDE